MEVLSEIIEWASTLPLWQQQAVLKVLEGNLDENAIKHLADLCLEESSDPDAVKARIGDPLKDYKFADTEDGAAKVVINSIRETKNINAIKDGSAIDFAPKGLTIIYGNNAVGKSGYSRIFKAACMCRDSEEVHGHIGRAEATEPSAVITFSDNDAPAEYAWNKNEDPNGQLKTVHVFDTRTARIYLSEENDVKYVPAGLDIFITLAKIFGQVRGQLEERIGNYNASAIDFEPLFSDYFGTEVYSLIADLTQPDFETKLNRLAAISQDEETRITTLKKEIKEKDSNNPVKRNQLQGQKHQRFVRVFNHMSALRRKLQDASLEPVHIAKTAMLDAQLVAEKAKQTNFNDDNFLPGTGGAAWKVLWRAAADFSSQAAYHGHDFPATDSDSKCVLCQQPLVESGQKNLRSFHQFVNDHSQETARKMRVAYEHGLAEFNNLQPMDEETRQNVFAELAADEYIEVNEIETLLVSLNAEYAKLGAALADENLRDKPAVEPLALAALSHFRQFLVDMDAEIQAFDASKYNIALQSLKTELNELEARELLKKNAELIRKELKNQELKRFVNKALSATATTALSRKSGELNNKYIVERLRDIFSDEVKAIFRDGLVVELQKAHVDHGVTYHEIVLSTGTAPSGADLNPEDVMSESEQKVISIAGFFAELSMAPHKSAVVFDDPVTSLDDLNVTRIARRMATEAGVRQVIVFTHNVFFTSELIAAAEKAGVPWVPRTVSKALHTGNVSDELPWHVLSVKKRLGWLRNKQQELTAMYNRDEVDPYEQGVKSFYQRLRDSWERAVEETLFNDVVKRYKRNIETNRLRDVKIEVADIQTIDDNMTHCSNFCHDQPAEANGVALPKPAQLLEDLEKLADWEKEVIQRRKAKTS